MNIFMEGSIFQFQFVIEVYRELELEKILTLPSIDALLSMSRGLSNSQVVNNAH